jgi:ABC-type polysaccharide/polyol phosphate export permease
MRLNPMTPIIEAYRSVLIRGQWPAAMPITIVAAFSCLFLGWAWLVFHRSEFQFAENA